MFENPGIFFFPTSYLDDRVKTRCECSGRLRWAMPGSRSLCSLFCKIHSGFFQWLLGTVLSSQFSSLVQGSVYMFLTVDKAEASPDWQDFNGPQIPGTSYSFWFPYCIGVTGWYIAVSFLLSRCWSPPAWYCHPWADLSFHTTGTFCPASHGSKYKTGICIYHAVVFHSGIPFRNTLLFLGSPNQC